MINTCSVKFVYQRRAATGKTIPALNSPAQIIRRAGLDRNKITFDSVVGLAKQLYTIDDKHDVALTWTDDENDTITMSTDTEFMEYARYMQVFGPHVTHKFGLLVKASARPPYAKDPAGPQPVLVDRMVKVAAGVCPEKAPMLKQAAIAAADAANQKHVTHPPSPVKTEVLCLRQSLLESIRNAPMKAASTPVCPPPAPATEMKTVEIEDKEHVSLFKLTVRHASCQVHSVSAGTPFTHVWRIRNDGADDIHHMSLKYADGRQLSIAGVKEDKSPFKCVIGDIKAGATKRVVINLIAPTEAGSYTTNFTLALPTGLNVGPPLTVVVDVTPRQRRSTATATKLFEPYKPAEAVAAPVELQKEKRVTIREHSTPIPPAVSPPVSPTPTAPEMSEPLPQLPPVGSAAPVITARVRSAWAAELEVLASMGFPDVAANIPLLQKHVQRPSRAAVGDVSNISNYALNEIVSDLISRQVIDVGSSDDDDEFVMLLGDGNHY